MATAGGPNIIEDGLVLYLDAANTKSYSGTGTAWNDLSGNGNSGTLINGPTFNSDNNGSIVFDGVNDYVNCGNSVVLNVNQFTANFWVYFNVSATKEILIKNNNTNNGIGPFEIYQAGTKIAHRINGSGVTGVTSLVINTWNMVTLTYNQVHKILYLNTVQENLTPYTTTLSISTGNLTLGAYGNANYPLNGKVAQLTLYNRALSAAEVLQNYNATKSRFNL